MQRVLIDQFSVSGLTIRTDNRNEMDPDKAKIGNLWQGFSENFQNAEDAIACYGVYSNFESDENGEFDLTVGLKEGFADPRSHEVTIPAGRYLRFEKRGVLPASVIELWQEIWQYFASNDAPQRLFKSDFEKYPDMNSVEIYIGIEEDSND